jgi:hypothetical protein
MVVEKLVKIRQDTTASFESQIGLKGHFAEQYASLTARAVFTAILRKRGNE